MMKLRVYIHKHLDATRSMYHHLHYLLTLIVHDLTTFIAFSIVSLVFFTAVITTVLLEVGVVSESVYASINLDMKLQPPSLKHPFGTDFLGRDILVRLIFGTRVVVYVVLVSVSVAILLGVSIGLVAGYLGGPFDLIISRVIDALMSFPAILLALAIVTILEPGIESIVLAIGIAETPIFARLTRGLVAVEKEHLYVEAARALGVSNTRILLKHILPNIIGPLIVQATFTSSSAILWESALSFLGLGAQPPTPSWGLMLAEAKDHLRTAPHAMIFPGLAIFLLVLSINIIGERLRDIMDPRFRSLNVEK